MRRLLALTTLGIAGLAFGPANAAVITENLNFSLSRFVDISAGSNIAPPNPLITGSITVTYDPTLSYDNDTTHLVVHSLTGITVDSPLGFTYSNGYLEFGGTNCDSDLVCSNTNDLVVAFNVTDPAHPFFPSCATPGYTCGIYTGDATIAAAGYTRSNFTTGWFYRIPNSVVSPDPIPTPTPGVPEPATLALLGLGLAGAGLTRRRSRS